MKKGLDESVKEVIIKLLEEGKSTKDILLELPNEDPQQVRSSVGYERNKMKKAIEKKSDPLAAFGYIDELEAELKKKDEEIAKLKACKAFEEEKQEVIQEAPEQSPEVNFQRGIEINFMPLEDDQHSKDEIRIKTLKEINKTLIDLI